MSDGEKVRSLLSRLPGARARLRAGEPRVRAALPAAAIALLYIVIALPVISDSSPYAWHGLSPVVALAASLGLMAALVALSVIDLETYELPDALTMPLACGGLAIHASRGSAALLDHALAAALGFLALALAAWAYRAVRGRDGLGLGDAKLLAGAGAWLGATALPSVVMIGAAAALASVAVAGARRGRIALADRLAFGPYLALGFWIVWLRGPLLAALE